MISASEYAKKVILSIILFISYKSFNAIHFMYFENRKLLATERGMIESLCMIIGMALLVYAVYIYFSSTIQRFELNGIPKWYALASLVVFGIYAIESVIGSYIFPMSDLAHEF